MKCFVASAFGRKDIDSIYDNYVFPALKKLSIKPLRVDRVEHNDDIDNKIIELLEGADLVIADLTYARPSVYYEAGYAAGIGKPVVYIARDDHFRARDDDPEGLLKVHFDLQMKNIISWSKANDAFLERLEKRLRHVLKPLINQQRKKLDIERKEFCCKSEYLKIKILKDEASSLLKTRSFRLLKQKSSSMDLVAIREYKQKSQQIIIRYTLSAIKRSFEQMNIMWLFGGFSIDSNCKLPVQFHFVVASLKPVPSSRVIQALPAYHPLKDGAMHHLYNSKSKPKIDTFVHVISGIQSRTKFTDALRLILDRYKLGKNA